MAVRLSVPNQLRGHFLDASLRYLRNLTGKSFVYEREQNSGEFTFGGSSIRYVIRPEIVEAYILSDWKARPRDVSLIEAFLKQVFSFEYQPYPFKIFGVGLPRTGTTSLAVALRKLGVFTLHCAPWMAAGLSNKIYRCQTTDDYDALVNSPFPLIYKQMDEIYPRSKFILTLRDVDAWLPSSRFLKGDLLPAYRRMYYGLDDYNEDVYRARFLRHRDEVIKYFSDRHIDFLVFDYSDGAGWDRLCSFLKLPAPNEPFPWANRRPPQHSKP